MKKSCYGCRASDIDKGCYECILGYSIDIKNGKPEEQCPKPKTINEYIIERNKLFFRGNNYRQ